MYLVAPHERLFLEDFHRVDLRRAALGVGRPKEGGDEVRGGLGVWVRVRPSSRVPKQGGDEVRALGSGSGLGLGLDPHVVYLLASLLAHEHHLAEAA